MVTQEEKNDKIFEKKLGSILLFITNSFFIQFL